MNVSGLSCRYCALLLTHLCLAISLVSIRMLQNVGVHAFWFISGFMWFLCVCLVQQRFCVWKLRERLKVVICAGDCCSLLRGFRILFWAHVSGMQSYISIWKVNLVKWCRLKADRGDYLCERQVVGLDGICKLQWGDSFKSFYFLWTLSCVMSQMWRDRMQCRSVLGVRLIMKASVNVIWVYLCFCEVLLWWKCQTRRLQFSECKWIWV